MKYYKYKDVDKDTKDVVTNEAEKQHLDFLNPIKKPRLRFVVMAIFYLFVLGNIRMFFKSYEDIAGSEEITNWFINGVHLVGLVIIYGIFRLNKTSAYLAAGISVVSILIQSSWMIKTFMLGNLTLFIFLIQFVYMTLSGFCIFYLLRPDYRKLMDRNEAHNRYIAMQGIAQDSLKK